MQFAPSYTVMPREIQITRLPSASPGRREKDLPDQSVTDPVVQGPVPTAKRSRSTERMIPGETQTNLRLLRPPDRRGQRMRSGKPRGTGARSAPSRSPRTEPSANPVE